MSFFIAEAAAQTPGAASGGGSMTTMLLIYAAIVAGFYFFFIRPKKKQETEHRALMSALKRGDEVATATGLIGRVSNVGDNYVLLEIAQNTEVRMQRSYVIGILPKGTYKGSL